MSKSFIPIYEPYIAKNQKKYVLKCIESNIIGNQGPYIDRFESEVASYLGVSDVITVCNGSVSLSLILTALGIGRGDEVISPSLTYAATISSIHWSGAKAILTDSDSNYQMNLDQIEKCITSNTKAVMVPQLYGDSPNMDKLVEICNKNNLFLIEDSAEVFGSDSGGKKLGSYGIASSFSLFPNKTIHAGSGGFIATNDTVLAKHMRLLRSQSHIGNFVHNGPGYNYRWSELNAAIGCAQLEHLDWILKAKKRLTDFYVKHLPEDITYICPKINSSHWMPVFQLPYYINYMKFSEELKKLGVDCRPIFTPIHLMEGFNIGRKVDLGLSEKIYKIGFNLPCYPTLTIKQLNHVISSIKTILKRSNA